MKRLVVKRLLVIVGLSLVSGLALADGRQISVLGEGELFVSADKAAIHAGIEHWDRSLTVAKRLNEEALKRVLDLTEQFKIAKESIFVDHIGVEVERKGWNEKPVHQTEGYFVRRNLTFVLKDLARFDDFFSRLLDVGVNQIHSVEFQSSELRKHRDAARDLAVKAAHEKASAMAKALGQKAGRALNIKEEQDTWQSRQSYFGSARAGAMSNVAMSAPAPAGTELGFPGKISVKASVSAVFQLD